MGAEASRGSEVELNQAMQESGSCQADFSPSPGPTPFLVPSFHTNQLSA